MVLSNANAKLTLGFFWWKEMEEDVLALLPEEARSGYECGFEKACELKKRFTNSYVDGVLNEFESLPLEQSKRLWDGLSRAMKQAVYTEFVADAFVDSYRLEGATEEWLLEQEAVVFDSEKEAYEYHSVLT